MTEPHETPLAQEPSFEGLCVGGPRDGKPLASRLRRVTIPFVIRDEPGLGAGYYEFDTEGRIWNWRGLSAGIVSGDVTGAPTQDMISCLKTQADNIEDTAKRCNDPVIVAELQYIGSQLREEAKKVETPSAADINYDRTA